MTFWTENWHTGYSYPGKRSQQFWFLATFELEKRTGQTDRTDGRTGKTLIAAY